MLSRWQGRNSLIPGKGRAPLFSAVRRVVQATPRWGRDLRGGGQRLVQWPVSRRAQTRNSLQVTTNQTMRFHKQNACRAHPRMAHCIT